MIIMLRSFIVAVNCAFALARVSKRYCLVFVNCCVVWSSAHVFNIRC